MGETDAKDDMPGGVPTSLTYRPDIDGLRAVAVLPVVLFHAGAGFSGGFVGVDIFFVISGYLISLVLLREWDQGHYSIIRFYERRIRRIIPALFAVVIFCFAFSVVLLIPRDFRDFSASAISATTFVSNVLFYEQSGYFQTAAHYKPLLHTWSLAVEEQFYILYPPLLWLALKYFRRMLPALLAIGILVSLGLSELAVWKRPDAAFYLSPFRAWELLIGCLFALGVFPRVQSPRLRNAMTLAAAAALLCAIFLYSPDTPFPGLTALLPCVGAALLLHAHESGSSHIGDLLSSKPFVFVGKISYSLYMWHWPLLVLTRLILLRPLSVWEGLAVAGLSVIAATVSWRYIELPFRKSEIIARKRIFAVAGIGAFALLSIGSYGFASGGLLWRYSPKVNAMAAYADSSETTVWLARQGLADCFQGEDAPSSAAAVRCMAVSPHKPNILVWGDSHAAYSFAGIRALGGRDGIATQLVSMAGCLPLAAVARPAGCSKFDPAVLSNIGKHKYSAVVLMGHWYAQQRQWHGEGRREDFFNNLSHALSVIHDRGIPVILVGPLPEYDEPLPVILARSLASGGAGIRPAAHLEHAVFDLDKSMRARFTKMDGVTYVSALDSICAAGSCVAETDGVPIELDQSHFTLAGARKVMPDMLAAAFSGLLQGAR